MWVPFPYVGDLLLFIQGDSAPYCVNWTIKLRPEDFSRSGLRFAGRARVEKYERHAELRHEIEESYYRDAGVRTVRLTSLDIDRTFVANLRMLFGWHSQEISVEQANKNRALEIYRDAIDGPTPAYQLVLKVANVIGASEVDAKAMLYQAIWRRELKVELFSPLLIDQPLVNQKSDPIRVYDQFVRSA